MTDEKKASYSNRYDGLGVVICYYFNTTTAILVASKQQSHDD